MLINNNGINSNNLSSNQVKGSTENQDKASKAVSDADSVNLSADAHLLTRLETAVSNASDVDASRVEAIRQAIDSGNYSIDAEAIANNLLNSDAL